MNEIQIECKECGQRLIIARSRTNFANDLTFEVTPCGCDSTDCSKCEDLKILNETNAQLKEKLATIKAIFTGEGYQPDEDSPDEKTNLPTDKDVLESVCECKEHVFPKGAHSPGCPLHIPEPAKPNIKNLPATKDIVSTGGAIIPGIKKGSGENVKATYGESKGDESGTHK